jgi:hypothetical protein
MTGPDGRSRVTFEAPMTGTRHDPGWRCPRQCHHRAALPLCLRALAEGKRGMFRQ